MESGVDVSPVTPRQVIKDAFAAKLLDDGQLWMDMLVERNLLAHTYDKTVFDKAVEAIHARYLPALASVRDWLSGRLAK
jgi:nucleotidyltransferase substrate binding protein (TIGR01987 family)